MFINARWELHGRIPSSFCGKVAAVPSHLRKLYQDGVAELNAGDGHTLAQFLVRNPHVLAIRLKIWVEQDLSSM